MSSLFCFVLLLFSVLSPALGAPPLSALPATLAVAPRTTQPETLETVTRREVPNFRSTADLLHYFYSDMTRLSQVADPKIVLHRWNDPKNDNLVVGRAAVQAHLEGFIAATGGTLFMDFKEISANEHFGSVMGMLRVGKPGGTVGQAHGQVSVPFCGVWKFKNGKPIEHWENVGEGAEKLARWMEEAGRG